jgi:hypothetical protein
MKTIRRLALVLALTLGAAACSTNIMGPNLDAVETPQTEEIAPDGNNISPDGNNISPDGNNISPDGNN